MQVAQTKAVGIVDNDGVGISNIYAILDDGCGKQYVKLSIYEVHNQLLELLGGHTAMTNTNTCLGAYACYKGLYMFDILDAIMHKVYLSSSRQLLFDGIADYLFGEYV